MQCDFLNKGEKGGELMRHSIMSSVALKRLIFIFDIHSLCMCSFVVHGLHYQCCFFVV